MTFRMHLFLRMHLLFSNRLCVEHECDRGLADKLRASSTANFSLELLPRNHSMLMKSARPARPQIGGPQAPSHVRHDGVGHFPKCPTQERCNVYQKTLVSCA